MDQTLRSTRFVDADSQVVRDFAAEHAGTGDDVSKAVNLYYALRDAVSYDMRTFGLDEDQFVASTVLQSTAAFCVPKAVALAALARAVGIPSRIGFANVRNHLASPKLMALMDDDVFYWHAYTSLFLDGKWVKATPAFDIRLCERHGVTPLDFDGREDSIFQPYDRAGRPHMEYVDFIGEFDDMPYDGFAGAMRTHHARMLKHLDDERAGRPTT
ncbi:transglutaminase domain-containing protein [Mesorhizobium sp. J428]|uniref:transglutaminase domain-containing protein n=1 Tax=Mesorhizobium sp. J428 TaxID=2898440 RepID=UPI0021514E51|nr:transglutaminase domain-containing protein [Mesorhizobium sp. J428]MCR5855829.1 transglutaminase [Mesorhizobium sp. J428]